MTCLFFKSGCFSETGPHGPEVYLGNTRMSEAYVPKMTLT